MRDGRDDLAGLALPRRPPCDRDPRIAGDALADQDRSGLRGGEGDRDLERPLLLVDAHRREVDEAVRLDRAPEVDRLAARADERELRAPGSATRRHRLIVSLVVS